MLRYHKLVPQNNKSLYSQSDTIDFVMTALGRSFIPGSIRLEGEVVINNDDPTDYINEVCYSPLVGGHVFIDSVSTTSELLGQLEYITDYNRYVSALADATLTKNSVCANSIYVCEARAPTRAHSWSLLKGTYLRNETEYNDEDIPTTRKPLDFSLQLQFCLNNVVNSNVLPYSKTGDLRVSLILADVVKSLFGNNEIGSAWVYHLKNLRLVFQSLPDDGKAPPQLQMRVHYGIKQSIQSTFSNLSVKAPMVCDSVFMTFIKQENDANNLYDSMANERLPNVDEIQWLWNSATNELITYSLDNQQEILTNYLMAVSSATSASTINGNTLASNKSYGVGLQFGMAVDLRMQSLGINIRSAVESTDPYTCYVFFNGFLSI